MLLNLQQTYGNTWRILTTDLYSLIKQLTAVNIWDLQLTGKINKWLPLVVSTDFQVHFSEDSLPKYK